MDELLGNLNLLNDRMKTTFKDISEFEKLTGLSLYDFNELYKAGYIQSLKSFSNALSQNIAVHDLIKIMNSQE